MSRQSLKFTQLAIARAVAGVRQGGADVAKIEIEPDGKITVTTTTEAPAEPEPPNDLDKAKARLREKLKEL